MGDVIAMHKKENSLGYGMYRDEQNVWWIEYFIAAIWKLKLLMIFM